MADEQGTENKTENPQEARGKGGSAFSPTFLIESVKKPNFWAWVIGIFILLFVAWLTNFLNFRVIVSTFLYTFGFTLLGLVTVLVMICFILYGWFTCKGNLAKFYIATALFIWMLDLAPEINLPILHWLGSAYQGFEFPFTNVQAIWSIPWLPILGSSATFAFLYINMVYKIIKKEYIAFILSFGFIILFNYLTNQLPTYLRFGFTIPYGRIIFLILLIFFGWLAWKFDKKRTGEEIPEFFSTLYLIFVFSFFWLNTGWQGNLKAWFHVLFIIAFGFGYIKPKAENNAFAYMSIATLLFIDFYGYGLLYSSDILALQFIPPLVIFVILSCYHIETEKGTKNYTYPVAAFILLVTFILVMSVNVAGLQGGCDLPFVAKKGTDFKDLFSQFTDKLRSAIEGRLDIATAGLYSGNVEKNRYESLGVYFANVRAADPRFYADEPITLWGTIRSKTYQDAVIVNFSCYRWKDNQKIVADKIVPNTKFPIFTLEDVDTECTFFPKKDKQIQSGPNTVTFSAEYNFGTDAYLKAYFIDRDRFKAYARENVDPLTELGIKDRNPFAVFTNGPVEIGIGSGTNEPLIKVSEGYTVKPSIGITLTNRKEITDKDKKIITKWEGKIKNITELILLVPPGIEIPNLENCNYPNDDPRFQDCPCSMPFVDYDVKKCQSTCTDTVLKPCNEACDGTYKIEDEKTKTKEEKDRIEEEKKSCKKDCETSNNKCSTECEFLFKPIGESTAEGKNLQGSYKGYALDVGSLKFKNLNKDIDKHRSFVCRINPTPAVLDNTPITTRYFRVRARYNYLLENSVQVNVETPPLKSLTTQDTLFNIANSYTPSGISPDYIIAIANVESGLRHCCQEAGKTSAKTCVMSDEKKCTPDKIITSGTSIGIMQVRYDTEKVKNEVNQRVARLCNGNTIYDFDCNVKVGIDILKEKFFSYRNGCQNSREYKTIKTACDTCKTTGKFGKIVDYNSYMDVGAAIRGYNGWGCDAVSRKGAYDADYVERVKATYDKIKNGQIIDESGLKNLLSSREGEGMVPDT